jgi:hypothetical protein
LFPAVVYQHFLNLELRVQGFERVLLEHNVEGLDVGIFVPLHVVGIFNALKGVYLQVEQDQENH